MICSRIKQTSKLPDMELYSGLFGSRSLLTEKKESPRRLRGEDAEAGLWERTAPNAMSRILRLFHTCALRSVSA